MNELIEINKLNAVEVFTGDGLDPLLKNIHAVVDAFEPDISTAGGRSDIASLAHRVARSKTFLDDQGKKLGDEARATVDAINRERKRMRDNLDALKEKVRKPLTEYEQVERVRVEAHEADITEIAGGGQRAVAEWDTLPLEAMRDRLAEIQAEKMGEDRWQEFAGLAAEAKDKAIADLTTAIGKREDLDAEKAESERLRLEAAERAEEESRQAAEREAKEREEQARREGEEKARQEIEDARLTAEKEKEEAEARTRQAEADAKAAAEKAEKDRIEAAEQAKRNEELAARRERDRIAAEERAERDAEAARKADEQHREAINEAACTALVGAGLNVDHARKAVTAIQMGHVPNVRINY